MKLPFDKIAPEIQAGCTRPNGIMCTHCGRSARMYSRLLGDPIAKELILLYRVSSQGQFDAWYSTRELHPRDHKASTDLRLARFWDLIEISDKTNDAGARAGMFRLTDKGRRFVQNLEFVPRRVLLYNNHLVQGPEGPLISIKEATDLAFKYEDLMKGV